MRLKIIAVAAALVAGAAYMTPLATAETLHGATTTTTAPAAAGLVQEVAFGRCISWRRTCAARWGWGTPRFYRCMRRHAC